MPFLPSLLEYNPATLEQKIKLINKDTVKFEEFQGAEDDRIHIHLDFVLPEFAKSRDVEPSNLEATVFDLLEKHLAEERLFISIHLMGLDNDLDYSFDFLMERLSNYLFDHDWIGEVFVPSDAVEDFEPLAECSNFKIGEWLDLGQWSKEMIFDTNATYLLMTVKAGKSGQKLSDENMTAVKSIANKYKNSKFTVDGGWGMNSEPTDNLSIVSYSSFWKEFGLV